MNAFFSYSHPDIDALQRLKTHCSVLLREGKITLWFDREITAGSLFSRQISAQLESSDLFIPLVSPDFLSSHYCYNREMKRAIERSRRGVMTIVPVILEPCDWKSSPLRHFKALPRDGKAISTWSNENEALLDVVTELRRLLARRPPRGKPLRSRRR
jgi:hypothetical protein